MSLVVSGRSFRSVGGLSQALQLLLILGIVGDVASLVVTWLELRVLGRYLRGEAGSPEANAAIDRSAAVGVVVVVIFVMTVIVWLVWQHRAQSNLHALGIGQLRFTPGWAVGWWLIPIADLWKPFETMREVWKASSGDANWWTERTWPLVGYWWAGFLTFNFLDNVTIRFFVSESATIRTFMVGDRVSLAADLCTIAAAILAIALIRSVAARQDGLPDRVADQIIVPPRPDLTSGP